VFVSVLNSIDGGVGNLINIVVVMLLLVTKKVENLNVFHVFVFMIK